MIKSFVTNIFPFCQPPAPSPQPGYKLVSVAEQNHFDRRRETCPVKQFCCFSPGEKQYLK